MKKTKKKILFGLLLTAAALGAAAAGAAVSGGKKVEMAEVLREDVEDWYTEEGVISLGDEYRVIAEAAGPVQEICVSENSEVKKGDLLFRIDDTDYRYEKKLAESTLAGYEAQLSASQISQVMTTSPQEYLTAVREEQAAREAEYQAAKTVYEANQVLYESGNISRAQLESGEAEYRAALLAYEQAKERYEESSRFLAGLKDEGIDESTINSRFYESERKKLEAQIQAQETAIEKLSDQIAKCTVVSGWDGVVTELPIDGMTAIAGGEEAAVIRSLDGVRAEADVLTTAAPYIKEGTPVKAVLSLRGADETYEGEVSQVYGYAAKGTSALGLSEYRVHVKAVFADEAAFAGRDGYGVDLKFLLYEAKDGLTVPSGAVFSVDDEDFVYQIRDGLAVKVPVTVAYQTGTKAVIGDGLSEGDRVIAQADAEEVYEGARLRAAK